ncbi:MAG TPA: glycosyltransferase family 9 protein [Vicinamibacterales bacterium]|jgi:ADP-heptose:LPS heptosyltransferase|nr:glycosyltransferase family 9 protein [Vicinamibacterales bacterium]
MSALHIYDQRERRLVQAADLLLAPARLRRRRPPTHAPQSILCFRLERIGDLLMALPALATLRAAAPSAELDLVVGSWNSEIARAIPGVGRVEVLDAHWLARGQRGRTARSLVLAARRLKSRRYDVAINFEPDIRSNAMTAAVGARWTAGFSSGGGGALLDLALPFDATRHTSDNLVDLAHAVTAGWCDQPAAVDSRLQLDEAVRRRAAERLAGVPAPIVAMHVNGGRAIKQWPLDRFADVARWLAEAKHATVVFTGSEQDRAPNAVIRTSIPAATAIDVAGVGLGEAAALLERCDLLVTGDTGPMHLAHAVGTPVVAVFGPSDPRRYAPRGLRDRIVRIDLPCAPCNRIRQPPRRCIGHTPDCLAGVSVAAVTAAIDEVLGSLDARGGKSPTIA